MATLHPKGVEKRKENDTTNKFDPETNRNRIEREIEEWGELLEELKAKPDAVGRETIEELERRYLDIRHDVITFRRQAKNRAEDLKQKTSEQTSSLAKTAVEKAEDMASTVSEHSKAAARLAKENTKEVAATTKKRAEDSVARISDTARDLKKGSQDVAEATKRAWDESKKALELAVRRLK